jgi:hypothetical protein
MRVFLLPTSLRGIWRSGKPSQLFNGTKPDAIGLSQRAVDSASFGHPHLSATDKRRGIQRIGVAVADETF